MNGLATAQRNYDRQMPRTEWDSEQDRQEAIARLTKIEADAINGSLLANTKNLRDIAADMFDKLSTYDMELILLFAQSGDATDLAAMRYVILGAKKRAVADVAEFRAIKAIEEHSADAFAR